MYWTEEAGMGTTEARGPFAYENWRAALLGTEVQRTFECPMFTDAHVTGGASDRYGPYQLINTVRIPDFDAHRTRPSVILRVDEHFSFEPPRMDKTDASCYHGGDLPDEIAALISLCLGIRLRPGGRNRVFERDQDPKGHPISWDFRHDPTLPEVPRNPVLPRLTGTHSLEDVSILMKFPALSPEDAITLVRAARFYQEAVWMVESAPEISWIMLTSAIETAAGRWQAERESPLEKLKAMKPKLYDLLDSCADERFALQIAEMVAPYVGSTKKFVDFLLNFRPDAPQKRPEGEFQHPWDATSLRSSFKRIYDYRSRALHAGVPFPDPMCWPPMLVNIKSEPAEVPIGLAAGSKGGVWLKKDIPMLLHTFEYIARHALLNWWRSIEISKQDAYSKQQT